MNSSPPRHQAIIGDGATAAAFLAAADLRPGDALTLIGPAPGRFGAGRVYADHASHQPWRFAYLLDRQNTTLGAGFAGWLAVNWPELRQEIAVYQPQHLDRWADSLSSGDFGAFAAPRALFGRYMAEQSRAWMAKLADAGIEVQLIAGLVTDIGRQNAEFRVTLAGGEVLRADRVDVATGGPGNQRFGSDAGPTAFTTLHGNEEAIAKVLQPGWDVTCLGASDDVLDVIHFLRAAMPGRMPNLHIIGDVAASGLERDPVFRALQGDDRLKVTEATVVWAYAEAAGKVRLRLLQSDGTSQEITVPLALNTAGPGEQLNLDLMVSGLIARGWLELDEERRAVSVGPGFSARIDGLRYASDAVGWLDGVPWRPQENDFESRVRQMRCDPAQMN